LCNGPAAADETIDAGGDVGRVHRTCFVDWDRQQEAREVASCLGFLGDPGESRTELEVEDAPARAA
jgi:hypothetical protein